MKTSKEIADNFFDRTHSEIDHEALEQLYFDLHKEVLNEGITKDQFLLNTNKQNAPYYENQEPMIRSNEPVQEPLETQPTSTQDSERDELQATLKALSDAGIQFDPTDNNALKGLLKAYKGNEEIYCRLLAVKKLNSRSNRNSDATEASNYKRREQLDEVQIIIEDWNNPPAAGGHL